MAIFFIFVANQTPQLFVYYDNLQLTHVHSPVLEETSYYPSGLTMAGISYKAAGKLENKYKFNGGNELQHGEFSDGSGLDLYDAHARMYDPQAPHFGQPDPLADLNPSQSPYNFASNNPVSRNDPSGLSDTTVNGQLLHDTNADVTVVASKKNSSPAPPPTPDLESMMKSFIRKTLNPIPTAIMPPPNNPFPNIFPKHQRTKIPYIAHITKFLKEKYDQLSKINTGLADAAYIASFSKFTKIARIGEGLNPYLFATATTLDAYAAANGQITWTKFTVNLGFGALGFTEFGAPISVYYFTGDAFGAWEGGHEVPDPPTGYENINIANLGNP